LKTSSSFTLVLVTAPDLKTARRLARAALEAKLIACANLIPKIESHYWWQGKVESGAEVLLVLKTRKARVAALERLIVAEHPYDTPEFLERREPSLSRLADGEPGLRRRRVRALFFHHPTGVYRIDKPGGCR
jgi:periplasmic divalent cation tolerance protein